VSSITFGNFLKIPSVFKGLKGKLVLSISLLTTKESKGKNTLKSTKAFNQF
jgi:hypothetical protein